jgi:hypothetical protein
VVAPPEAEAAAAGSLALCEVETEEHDVRAGDGVDRQAAVLLAAPH